MALVRWVSTGGTGWATGANWSGASAPIDADDVVFNANSYDVAASDQTATELTTLRFEQSYTGKVGDVSTYLQIDSSALEIGRDDEGRRWPGSSRLNLDMGSIACNITVINTCSQAADTGYLPVRLKANSASTNLRIRRGLVMLAGGAGETSTIGDIEMGELGAKANSARLVIGDGLTMDDLTVLSGTVSTRSSIDAARIQKGGELFVEGAAAVATLNLYGGYCYLNTTGTVTACTVKEGGTLDTTGANSARTITTLTLYPDSTLLLHPLVTITNLVIVQEVATRTRVEHA